MKPLLVITQIAGILLLAGIIVLLFFRRIYLDSQTKKPIKFSLPLFGEISTQAPVLVLVLIGALMVVYPLSKMPADTTALEGEVDTGGRSVSVLILPVPDYQYTQDASGHFRLEIPLLATNATYRVKFIVDRQVIDDQELTLEEGRFRFNPLRWSPPAEESVVREIQVRKDVSDEELESLLPIAN